MKTKLFFLSICCAVSATANAQKAFVDGTPLKVCNAATHTAAASIGHSGNFDGLDLSSDGSKLLAYNETLNRAYIINTATNAIIDSCSFINYIGNMVFGPGNTLYYSENPTNRIYKYDWSTKTKVDSSISFSSGAAFMMNRPSTQEIWFNIDNKMYSFTQSSMALTSIANNVSASQYISGGLIFNASGSTVYYMGSVTGSGTGKIYKMNAGTKAIEDSVITPNWHGNLKNLTVSNDTTLYISFFGQWPNEPSRIYIAKSNNMAGGLLDSVNTPYKPFAMVERPGTNELWVVYHYNAKVGILNKAANLTALDSIVVGTSPKLVVFTAGSTSVAQATIGNKYSVHPNPGNGIYYIDGLSAGTPYTVTDVAGKQVATGTVNNKRYIDITHTQPGIYYLKLWGTKAQTLVLVKN